MIIEHQTVEQQLFGEIGGEPVTLYTIKNMNGFQVSCIDYGCIITEILAPDRTGNFENVVLGFDTLDEYKRDVHFLGAVAGRFAGRIKNGRAEIEGESHQLGRNSEGHHLHGGASGWHSVKWKSSTFVSTEGAGVQFTYTSPDGEEGYPGNLEMTVRYFVKNAEDELIISYSGIADQTTLLNPTNHSYFNLSGDLKRDVLDHQLRMPSPSYLELGDDLLPTGEIVPVDGTVFDLRSGKEIRSAVESEHPQTILAGSGFDHPFLLVGEGEITAEDPESGRKLTVSTTEPAVVLYTGNGLGGSYTIRGTAAKDNLGFCLETQKLPDSPNHPNFGSAILKAEENYTSETTFAFGVTSTEEL